MLQEMQNIVGLCTGTLLRARNELGCCRLQRNLLCTWLESRVLKAANPQRFHASRVAVSQHACLRSPAPAAGRFSLLKPVPRVSALQELREYTCLNSDTPSATSSL